MKLNKKHIVIGIVSILLLSFFNTNSQSSIENQLVGVWQGDGGTYLEFFGNGLGEAKNEYFDLWYSEISWRVVDNTIVLDEGSDGMDDYMMPITSDELDYLQFDAHESRLVPLLKGEIFQKIQN